MAVEATTDALFLMLGERIEKEGKKMVRRVGAKFRFRVSADEEGQGEVAVWVIDLKDGDGKMTKGDEDTKVDATIDISAVNFAHIVMGKQTPQQAFMKGKMKVKGNMMKAMQLNPLLAKLKPKAKL